MQALADIKPGVFRFPGGCIVEGTDIASRYDWKKSVGMVENRPLNENRWQYTFPHRFFPDYYQSYGLGFYEFFQLSEEIGAEPLPVLSCGLACQFQNPNMDAHVPLCDLESYIQDALDLIEFANGAVDTPWGKIRADMGHPAPFNLKLIGIGNEQWGKEYPEHLEPFVKAIRKKYPDLDALVPMHGTLTDQPMLELVFAIMLPAIGSAILFNIDASSGGTDVIAMILKKYTSMNIGSALMAADVAAVGLSFAMYGPSTGLFSVMGLVAKSMVVDNVIENMNLCKCFNIVCEHPQPICNFIIHELNRSATTFEARGAYSDAHIGFRGFLFTNSILHQPGAIHAITCVSGAPYCAVA